MAPALCPKTQPWGAEAVVSDLRRYWDREDEENLRRWKQQNVMPPPGGQKHEDTQKHIENGGGESPPMHTRFMMPTTRIRCGCHGSQIHVFKSQSCMVQFIPWGPTSANAGLWIAASEVSTMQPIESVMGIDWGGDEPVVYAAPSLWPPWEPDETTTPAIVHTDATVVCSCILFTADRIKQRRMVSKEDVPLHLPMANPFHPLSQSGA